MFRLHSRIRWPGSTFLLTALVLSGAAIATEQRPTALRVCADPNFAPFSTRNQEGFENKIARLLADELSLALEYTWFPQRMGFIRNTLRAKQDDGESYKCDLVMGIPEQFELAITTDPYYRSTYALVYPEGSVLERLESGNDMVRMDNTTREKLRIGMTERSPGTLWLARYGMYEQIAPYIAQSGDPGEFPGEPILQDLSAGNLDAAIVWGPTAGYFVSQSNDKKPLRILPLLSEPGVKFDFAISAGVRFGEKTWKEEINTLLKKNSEQILALLKQYNVPLVNKKGNLLN